MSELEIYAERLASVRKRIKLIRELLEDPSTASEIAIDGVSEKIPRSQLVAELKELEGEEIALMAKASGRSSRVYGIDLR